MRRTPTIIAILLLLIAIAAIGCIFDFNGAKPEPPTPTPNLRATIDAAVARVRAATPMPPPALPTHIPAPTIGLVNTPTPRPTPMPTLTSRPTLAPTPTVAPPTPTFTPVPTPTPTPMPQPTPTPVAPELRHLDGKRYMLELINDARAKAGLNPVALGDNIAAQLQAESSLANCTYGHWGVDGLKPYMRYSLAGGYQSNAENGGSLSYCINASDGYAAGGSLKARIDDAMDGWMNSAGHRRNILTPQHQKVNIGIAYDRYNSAMYQHFEGNYVAYDKIPSIANGTLSLSGTTKNGVTFSEPDDLGVQIYYDPPPHELTRGQTARSYCYDNGQQLAALREPLTGGYYWPTDTFTTTRRPCADPYDVPPEAPAPRTNDEAHQIWRQTYDAYLSRGSQSVTLPWITASEWTASGETFTVRADISDLLREHGNGVYSVTIWGTIAGEDAVISEYSIFHGITPPDTYSDDH